MKSKSFKSLITSGVFLVACGLIAWPGTAAAWGGGSIVFRQGSAHFGHRQTVFFPGALFRHRFGRGYDLRAGRVFRHRHCFGLPHRHLHGGFHHGQSFLIFRH